MDGVVEKGMKALWLLLGLLVAVSAAAAERRVALVIGNNDYQQVSKLEKAVNDAEAVGRELAKIGFDVVTLTNAGQKKMNQAINQFADKLAGGGVGVLFFAGHGLQINNQNFLLPVDMDLPRNPNDVADQAISLQVVQDKLADAKARFALLVIDACRNNPLPQQAGRSIGSTRGLAQPAAPNGQIVLFSAGAHQEALDKLSDGDNNPNGLFTREFLPMISSPGVSATEALRKTRTAVIQKAKAVGHDQHPALYDQTDGDFYFVPGAADAAAPAAQPQAVAGVDPVAIELEYWRGAQQANSIEAYQSYLNRYPKGQYAELAEASIKKLKGAPSSAVQRGAGSDATAIELALWETVSDSDDANEYREYLRQFPNGRFAAIAKNRIQALSAREKAAPETSAADSVEGLHSRAIQGDKAAQGQLRRLGEQGNGLAQMKLAAMHELGQGGMLKSSGEALRWYRKAANQGIARAQAILGIAHMSGRGVVKDLAEAAKWLRKAADQGDDRGQAGLGSLYMDGLGGLPRDPAEAIKWFRRSAEQGNANAQVFLGEAYESGLAGLPRDPAAARLWLGKAAEQGHPGAAEKLARVKTVDQLYEEMEGPLCKGKPFRFVCQSNLKARLCKEHNAYGKPGSSICPASSPQSDAFQSGG